MKPISTRVHGMLDYAVVALLLILPRLLGWDDRVTSLVTVAAVVVLLSSLMTRYELSAIKLLPMPVHLALDALVSLAVLGMGELGAALLTQTHSPVTANAPV